MFNLVILVVIVGLEGDNEVYYYKGGVVKRVY